MYNILLYINARDDHFISLFVLLDTFRYTVIKIDSISNIQKKWSTIKYGRSHPKMVVFRNEMENLQNELRIEWVNKNTYIGLKYIITSRSIINERDELKKNKSKSLIGFLFSLCFSFSFEELNFCYYIHEFFISSH